MSASLSKTLVNAMPSASPSSLEKEETRILIVDDDGAVRGLFYSYLSERYECATAASFDEAVALLQTQEFTLVLSDPRQFGGVRVDLNALDGLRADARELAREPQCLRLDCDAMLDVFKRQ